MSLKEGDTQFKPALNNTHALYQDVREPVIGPSGNLFSLVVLPTGEFAVANLTKLTLGLPIYTDLGYGETNAELIDIKGLTFGSTGMPFAVVIGKDIDPHSSKPIEKAYAAAIGPHAIAAPSLNAKGSPPKWWFNIRNM